MRMLRSKQCYAASSRMHHSTLTQMSAGIQSSPALTKRCAHGQVQAAPQLQRGFYRVNEQGSPEQQPPSEWIATVDDELPTLAEVFARVPQHIGFDIEVRLFGGRCFVITCAFIAPITRDCVAQHLCDVAAMACMIAVIIAAGQALNQPLVCARLTLHARRPIDADYEPVPVHRSR